MRVPSFQETQAHLREVGFSLERIADAPEFGAKYRLKDPDGSSWGRYTSLSAFWSFWLGYASEVLFQDRIVEAFVGEFRNAGPRRRSEMIDWYEGWLSDEHPEHYESFLATIEALDPDNLPEGWEARLKNNLHGQVAGRRAEACIAQMLSDIDPLAYKRFKELPARRGLPQLQLVN